MQGPGVSQNHILPSNRNEALGLSLVDQFSADQWEVGTYMGDDDGCCWVPAAGHHGPVVAPVPDTVDTVTVKSLNHKYTVHRIL